MTIVSIVSDIVELSLEGTSDDPVRNLYSVCMEIELAIIEIMRLERKNGTGH